MYNVGIWHKNNCQVLDFLMYLHYLHYIALCNICIEYVDVWWNEAWLYHNSFIIVSLTILVSYIQCEPDHWPVRQTGDDNIDVR